jgi:hypothetical protein
MRLTFRAIKRGANQLELDEPEAYWAAVSKIKEGDVVGLQLIVGEKSSNQLGYYWGVVVPTMKRANWTDNGILNSDEEYHEFLKRKYRYEMDIEFETLEADKAAMAEYISWCIDYANTELNTRISKPLHHRKQ